MELGGRSMIAAAGHIDGDSCEVSAARQDRLPALDLLRFCAALSVVGYHYVSSYVPVDQMGPWLLAITRVTRYGYLGVDSFFIISGFVILWSAQGKTVSAFVVSRISRLYPSFWAAMLLTSAFVMLLGSHISAGETQKIDIFQLLSNATMLPSVLGSTPIDGVYWTLEIEIRFYFLVFLLLVSRQMINLERWLYVWLAVCTVGLLWSRLPWIVNYMSLSPHGPLFIGGCFVFVIRSSGLTLARTAALLASVGLSMAGAYRGRESFITPDHVSALVAPTLVLGFFVAFIWILSRDGSVGAPALVFRLGALSYPLYLTHAAIGRLIMEVLMPRVGVDVALGLTTVVALGIAQVLVVTVDEPARKPMGRLCTQIGQRLTTFIRKLLNGA
jgi:peptidoglycan/LPS O-acetylase OafA/YrhL